MLPGESDFGCVRKILQCSEGKLAPLVELGGKNHQNPSFCSFLAVSLNCVVFSHASCFCTRSSLVANLAYT
jgi:hypothetical protein